MSYKVQEIFQPQTVDLLLTGGHVIDPASGFSGTADVAVKDGRIAAVGFNLRNPSGAEETDAVPSFRGAKEVDVTGYFVTPGLIDMHCHCYPFFPLHSDGLHCIHPDGHMFQNGITTCVDAGTCGWYDFPAFYENVIQKSRVRVLAFLNIADGGMVHMETEQEQAHFHPGLVAEVAREYTQTIVGIKSAHYWVGRAFDTAHPPWASVDAMTEAGSLCEKPGMADMQPFGAERSYPELILKHLRPGDIHTHVYAQQFPILDENGQIQAFMHQARERGVIFDLAHGAQSFWFRQAIPAVKQGFAPDTVSTDLYMDNVCGPLLGLNHVMSKFFNMGLSLEALIEKVTSAPARILKHPELGSLHPGACADVAILKASSAPVCFADSGNARMHGTRRIETSATIRAGKVVYDPYAMFLPDWERAPEAYWTAPGILS